jgi:Predicted transcriptional regulators
MKQKTIKGRYYTMNVQKKLSQRIQRLCKNQGISFYTLSYKAAVPMTTLMHIINCSTKNPGIFTIIKICNGLNMTIKDFFDTKEFIDIEYETE